MNGIVKFLVGATFVVSGLFQISFANAAGVGCCVYYKPYQSGQCSLYGTDGDVIDLFGTKVFPCDSYNSTKKQISISGVGSVDIYENQAVLSAGIQGGYSVGALGSPSSVCYDAPSYVVQVKDKASNNAFCQVSEARLASGLVPNDLQQAVSGQAMGDIQTLKEAYATLEKLTNKVCCVPNQNSAATDCRKPQIRPEITEVYNQLIGGQKVTTQYATQFKSIVPNAANPNDGAILGSYSCGDVLGDWTSKYTLSGVSCAEIEKNNPEICKVQTYFCLCTNDRSTCDNTPYSKNLIDYKKEGGTLSGGTCEVEMGSRNGQLGEAGKKSWTCVKTEKPTNSESYCAHLTATPGEEPTGPEQVDVAGLAKKELNRIGTTDISIVLGRAINILMGVMGSIALAMFVYAGFLWMISGTTESIDKARSILVWSSMGIVVVFASYALVQLIFQTFS